MTTVRCGTYSGYVVHYRRGEKPCLSCRHARTVYNGRWRALSGRNKRALVPYAVLGALLQAAPSTLEEWAEQRLGDAVVTRALEMAAVEGVRKRKRTPKAAA